MKIHPFIFAFVILLLAVLLSIAVGSVFIPPADIWRILTGQAPKNVAQAATIILTLRLPRTALILLTGAALSVSGAAYQGLFRNPLADPYMIGVASGAGLGAVLAMNLHWPYSFGGLMVIPAAAFIGALAAVFIVYALARVGKTLPTTNLILAGVAFSSFASALTTYLIYHSTSELHRAIAWLFGGYSQAGWGPVLTALPYLAVGLGMLLFGGHALNLLQFGDDQAQQLGLPVTRTRTLILLAASLVTAAAVSFSGIIWFVGLIVPHIIRLWLGVDYRRLLPLSLIIGAAFLLLSDVIARLIAAPQEIPVGIITAIFGAPFFLWVLRRARNQTYW